MSVSIATEEIIVDSTRERVGNALTAPDLVRQYFMGAKATTDWQAGQSDGRMRNFWPVAWRA